MAGRRDLTFTGLDEVMPDVDRLLAGHVTIGRWSLGQILNHLATALRVTLDAPVRASEPTREQRVAHRLFFRAGKIPEGLEPPLRALIPPPDPDALTEADALRAVIERFQAAEGPFPSHPNLGPMTREEWARFHGMHCAHHLGFALPQ